MGSVISILWHKLCEACRWVVSKLKKFVNNLSEKINNLANRANRFSDNLTERLKESIAKANRAMDEKLEKIVDSITLLEKKLSSGIEAIDNEAVIQILKAARSMVKQIQDLLKSMRNFVVLIDEVSGEIRNKGVEDGVEEIKNIMSDKDGGDLHRVWFLAKAFSQLLSLYLKKQKHGFVFVVFEACALFFKEPNKNIKEMRKMESSDFKMLEGDKRKPAIFVYFALQAAFRRAPLSVVWDVMICFVSVGLSICLYAK